MRTRWVWLLAVLPLVLSLPVGAQRQRIFETARGGPFLQQTARAHTGVLPKSARVSPDGTRLVVCNFGQTGHDNVYLYDALTLDRLGKVEFPGNAVESAFAPDGRTLYVSNFRRDVLEVIDVPSLEVRAEVRVGSAPKTVTVSTDGTSIYVANYFGRSVSVVDAASLREVRRLHTGQRPRGLGVLAGGTLLAAAFRSETIHVFPGASDAEARAIETCPLPRDVQSAPEPGTYYVTCSLGHIGFYRLEDGRRPFGIATTGRNPRSIGLTRDGRWLGVANFGSSDVTLIDTVGRTHRRIEVPGASRIVGLAMHPESSPIRLYATSWDTGEVILLSGEPE